MPPSTRPTLGGLSGLDTLGLLELGLKGLALLSELLDLGHEGLSTCHLLSERRVDLVCVRHLEGFE